MDASSTTYGTKEHATAAHAAEVHAERIRLVGYTVVQGDFSAEELADIGVRMDAILERQAVEAGGADRLEKIGEQNTIRCCLAYDDAFLGIAAAPAVLEVCRKLLGDYFLLTQQNGVINPARERHHQAAYHRDLPYQHFVSSRPLAVSALLCVDAFTVDNGATVVVPASHKVETFPSDATLRELEHPVQAPAGSFIVFDSMLFHRAGHNVSAAPRRAVNHVYALPFVAQQISLPDALDGRQSDNPRLARLLGYGATPVPSVQAWWDRRRARCS